MLRPHHRCKRPVTAQSLKLGRTPATPGNTGCHHSTTLSSATKHDHQEPNSVAAPARAPCAPSKSPGVESLLDRDVLSPRYARRSTLMAALSLFPLVFLIVYIRASLTFCRFIQHAGPPLVILGGAVQLSSRPSVHAWTPRRRRRRAPTPSTIT